MKSERVNKKDLKKRLRYILAIYMDGLKGKKKEKFSKYLDDKLDTIVDYYVGLMKKKKRKKLPLPALPPDLLVDRLMEYAQPQEKVPVKEVTIQPGKPSENNHQHSGQTMESIS